MSPDEIRAFLHGRRTGKPAGRVSLSVDEEVAPYACVHVRGRASVSEDLDELLHCATRIGSRYMGEERADEFGRRNAVPGELLVRLKPERVIAETGVTA